MGLLPGVSPVIPVRFYDEICGEIAEAMYVKFPSKCFYETFVESPYKSLKI